MKFTLSRLRLKISLDSILLMVFKLSQSAEKRWCRLRGFKNLANVAQSIRFIDGTRAVNDANHEID